MGRILARSKAYRASSSLHEPIAGQLLFGSISLCCPTCNRARMKDFGFAANTNHSCAVTTAFSHPGEGTVSFDWHRELEILESRFPRYCAPGSTGNENGYASCFVLPNGRQIAVNTKDSEAMVWIEVISSFSPTPGIEVRNSKNPGQPYGPMQPRKSSLNAKNAPNLMGPRGNSPGQPAYCLNISDEVAFNQLLDWYAAS